MNSVPIYSTEYRRKTMNIAEQLYSEGERTFFGFDPVDGVQTLTRFKMETFERLVNWANKAEPAGLVADGHYLNSVHCDLGTIEDNEAIRLKEAREDAESKWVSLESLMVEAN